MKKIHNFSAGPAMLPKEVLMEAKNNFCNWEKNGFSIMEISHRSHFFLKVVEEIEINIRELLNIPNNYQVLFCPGGARGQFSAIPMNLLNKNDKADYIDSGYWSHLAAIESSKYCYSNIIDVKKKEEKRSILSMKNWGISDNSVYIHYCPNETISGIAIYEQPNFYGKTIICDFSSFIFSKVIDIKKYSLIYASSQKNIGPAGMTIVIIIDDLIKKAQKITPSILNYKILLKNRSMFNTPVTFSWYLSGLVFKWIKKRGGVKNIELLNQKKAKYLYSVIDSSNIYINDIHPKNRSITNVVFKLQGINLEKKFLIESEKEGFLFLKNHYIEGGIRASIYNSMSVKSVKSLAEFMVFFEKRYG
ncbi:Phosphoserine aminotransferase [Buchnera aphidicola (Tetraneura ulmi)]|uniref:3-phosphoserine/phosphohydroxythreonine transaminase n=1 Tax=Buchnera aphidicola TaxID=9 RepID=UPI003464E5C2